MGRSRRRKRSDVSADELMWSVQAPRTRLWRGQWYLTLGLYALAGVGIVTTLVLTMTGDVHAWASGCQPVVERSPALRWVGENWSWFRLVPAGLAGAVVLALHRPRTGALMVRGRSLVLSVGRHVATLDIGKTRVAWERWPGYPPTAARAFLGLDDGKTTIRVGLPDVPASADLPPAPSKHAAPDLVLGGAAFGEVRAALASRGLVVDPRDAHVPFGGAASPAAPGDDGLTANPAIGLGARLVWAWRRLPFAVRLLGVVAALAVLAGRILTYAVQAGTLPEQVFPLFSLVVIGVWVVVGIRHRNR